VFGSIPISKVFVSKYDNCSFEATQSMTKVFYFAFVLLLFWHSTSDLRDSSAMLANGISEEQS